MTAEALPTGSRAGMLRAERCPLDGPVGACRGVHNFSRPAPGSVRPGRLRTSQPSWAPVLAAEQVADLLGGVVGADQALAEAMDWIGGCRAPVCATTVARLDAVLGSLCDAVQVRQQLAPLAPRLRRAGGSLWWRRGVAARTDKSPPSTGCRLESGLGRI